MKLNTLLALLCVLVCFAAFGAAPPYVRNPWDTNAVPDGATATNATLRGATFVQDGLVRGLDSSQLQPLSQGTNFAVDFNVPISAFKPTNNVFFLYSTNFSSSGGQDKLFELRGSSSNYTLKFGTDFTNLFGVYTTNGYILGNSNSPHVLAFHIDAAHGTELIGIIHPNN